MEGLLRRRETSEEGKQSKNKAGTARAEVDVAVVAESWLTSSSSSPHLHLHRHRLPVVESASHVPVRAYDDAKVQMKQIPSWVRQKSLASQRE